MDTLHTLEPSEEKDDQLTTILMLTWNALPYVKATISSLLRSEEIFSLLIMDNGSNHEVLNYLEEVQDVHENMEVVFNNKNLGTSKARAQWLEMIDTPFTCLADSDLYFPTNRLWSLEKKLIQEENLWVVWPLKLSSRLKHPYIEGISLKEYWKRANNSEDSPHERLMELTFEQDFDTFSKDVVRANHWIKRKIDIPTMSISSCISLTRTDLLKDPTLNDPVYAKYAHWMEDVDYSWALNKSWYGVEIVPEAYVHHFEHGSLTDNKVDKKLISKIKKGDTNYSYFLSKWQDSINFWAKSQISKDNNTNGVLSDRLMEVFLDNVDEEKVPKSLKRLWHTHHNQK